jgi:pyridoxine 5-phosphate synthase
MNKYPVKRLGVNIDHVATLRQARGTKYPSPLQAAKLALAAGADGITIHLREDRRHIQDQDVQLIREKIEGHLNLEIALTQEMLAIALDVKPDYVCFVPEKRQELTTEGGLNLLPIEHDLKDACKKLTSQGVGVSLFIEANTQQIQMAKTVGANAIEIHTGRYADLAGYEQSAELEKITKQATFASGLGLIVNAGHGLHYTNVQDVVKIPEIYELNIGHSIISQAVFDGLEKSVSDMKALMF